MNRTSAHNISWMYFSETGLTYFCCVCCCFFGNFFFFFVISIKKKLDTDFVSGFEILIFCFYFLIILVHETFCLKSYELTKYVLSDTNKNKTIKKKLQRRIANDSLQAKMNWFQQEKKKTSDLFIGYTCMNSHKIPLECPVQCPMRNI